MPLKFPLTIWMSGEYARLVSKTIITKENADYLKCGFILSDTTKQRHNITNARLDLNNPEFPWGIYWTELRRNNLIALNDDPSDPVALIWNKFDGTMVNPRGELFMLSEMITDMNKLEAENKRLKAEITGLNNELLAISATYSLWKRRYGHVISPEMEEIGKLIAGLQKFQKSSGTNY